VRDAGGALEREEGRRKITSEKFKSVERSRARNEVRARARELDHEHRFTREQEETYANRVREPDYLSCRAVAAKTLVYTVKP